MSLNPFDDVQILREKEAEGVPIVTIFGAGVAGLTVAHELVERGFAVQVVETRPDPEEEYMCRIGGLAANRFARIPADLSQVHPYFFPEDPDGEDAVDPDAERWVDLTILGTGPVDVTVDGLTISSVAVAPGAADVFATALKSGLGSPPVAVAGANSSSVVRLAPPSLGRRDPLRVSVEPSEMVSVEEVGLLRPLREGEMRPVQRRYEIPQRFYFARDTGAVWTEFEDEQGVSNGTKLPLVFEQLRAAYEDYQQALAERAQEAGIDLDQDLTARMRIREELLVELRGHTDDEQDGGASRQRSSDWAELVRQGLLNENTLASNPIPDLDRRLVVVPLGHSEPVGRQLRQSGRDRSNRVEVRIVEHVIPGEHGYRFFPAFYRNLFDTMKRTPILDAVGHETGDTAFDQLVATHEIDVALAGGKEPQEVKLRWPRSFEELRKLLRLHLEKTLSAEGLELTERDLLRFYLRIVKFLTTSKERRSQVYEGESWWTFLGGDVLQGYSPAMRRLLQEAPQALVAMDAEETDARSQGVVFCQLLLDAISPPEGTNYTLNGPTTEAWLRQWKRYLRRQGVRFFVGRLGKIVFPDGDCVPLVVLPAVQGATIHVSVIEGNGLVSASVPYAFRVNGVEIRIVAGPASSVQDVRNLLVEALHGARLPIRVSVVESDPDVRRLLRSDPGGILLEGSFPPGDLVVLVRQVQAVDYTFDVNGESASFSVPAGSSAQTLRDALRNDFPAVDVDLTDFETHGLRITPSDEGQVISILGPGRVASVWIDGTPVEVRRETIRLPETLRDELLTAIQSQLSGLELREFGRTGIRVLPDTQGRKPLLDVRASRGTVGLGLVAAFSDGREDWLTFPGGALQARVLEGDLGLAGAIAENPDEALITDSVEVTPPPGGGPDFYVLAVDYPEASRIAWQAQADAPGQLDGCFAQLRTFDRTTGYRSTDGTLQPPRRDASGRPSPPSYPLRDLSGIQYYWSHQVRLGRGHTYFPDAAWGLSSIAQLAYWRARTAKHAAFLGQLSVDIGDWYESVPSASDPSEAGRPSAWRSSKQEIAEGIYAQVLEGIEANLAADLVRPDWYHLDPGIRFERIEGRCFGRRALLQILNRPPGSSYDLEVDGTPVSATLITTLGTLADDLANAIFTQTGHLAAHVSGDRVLIAPLVHRREPNPRDVLVTVSDVANGAVYRIARAGLVAQFTASTLDDVGAVRNGLVDAVNDTLPGVLAEAVGNASLRLQAAQDLDVSALGTGGPDPARSLLALDPVGEVRVRILPAGVPASESGLELANADEASPNVNDTPFLINGPGVWKQRPGVYDGVPLPRAIAQAYADEGGIYVRPGCDRWFMAGVHMATHTRLTTMESANESARHTVTAILYELLAATAPAAGPPPFNSAGKLLGDPPEIFDPEKHELRDADMLKRLDARLLEANLPHFIDILRLPELVDATPPDLATVVPTAADLGKLLGHALEQLEGDWDFTSADEVLAHLKDTLASFLA